MKTVHFYFDFISPYSWLALNEARSFADKHGFAWVMRPVVYGKLLDDYDFRGVPIPSNLQTMSRPLASKAFAGNVKIVEGDWNEDFLDQFTSFPDGSHDDDLASAILGYQEVSKGRSSMEMP